jgi:hypothetical protein
MLPYFIRKSKHFLVATPPKAYWTAAREQGRSNLPRTSPVQGRKGAFYFLPRTSPARGSRRTGRVETSLPCSPPTRCRGPINTAVRHLQSLVAEAGSQSGVANGHPEPHDRVWRRCLYADRRYYRKFPLRHAPCAMGSQAGASPALCFKLCSLFSDTYAVEEWVIHGWRSLRSIYSCWQAGSMPARTGELKRRIVARRLCVFAQPTGTESGHLQACTRPRSRVPSLGCLFLCGLFVVGILWV